MRARTGVFLVGLVLAFITIKATAGELPESVKASVLRGDWAGVLAALEKSDLKAPDAVCRMVAAHACLASNRNNQAAYLFRSVRYAAGRVEPGQANEFDNTTGGNAR